MPETHPVAEFSNIHVYDGDDVALTFLFGSPLPSSPFSLRCSYRDLANYGWTTMSSPSLPRPAFSRRTMNPRSPARCG